MARSGSIRTPHWKHEQSLPPILTNNGLVLFNQPDVGSYAGTISGIGQVGKMGGAS